MGQIRGTKAKVSACNIRSLSSFGIPYSGMHILVSTDNSAMADGNGDFDAYVVGDGVTNAEDLPLQYIEDEEPVAGSAKGIMSGWAHKFVKPITDELLEETQVDSDLTSSAVTSAGFYYDASLEKVGASSNYIATEVDVTGMGGGTISFLAYYPNDTAKMGFVLANGTLADVQPIGRTGYQKSLTIPANAVKLRFNWTNYFDSQYTQKIEVHITNYVVKNVVTDTELSTAIGEVEQEITDLTHAISEDESGVLDPSKADGVLTNYYVTASTVVKPYSNLSIWYKYFADDTPASYVTSYFASSVCIASRPPVENESPTEQLCYGTGKTGEFTIPAGSYLWWSCNTAHPENTAVSVQMYGDIIDFSQFATKEEISPLDDATAYITSMAHALRLRQRGDVFAPMLVDWMQYCHWINKMTSIAQMSVVSSTETTITLSAADAETITAITPIVVEFSDGTYKVIYFGAANGSTITRCAWETQDLTNAVSIQSLHDTVMGGGGIHLSQTGYLGIAQFTAEEIAKQIAHRDNYVTGFEFYNYTQSGTGLYAPNGDKVADITTDMTTGYGVDGNIACCEIRKNYQANYGYNQGWLLDMFFILQQNAQGKTATFTLPAYGDGYVEVIAGLADMTGNRIGGATIELFADDVSQGTRTLYQHCMRYTFTGVKCKKTLKLVITISSNSPTGIVIGSFGFWNLASDVPAVDLTGKKIAVLGDSWTQFPGVNDGLADHASYNVRVVRPNGTDGDGFGYFPKELARVTGASVDNWGKSNMRADNWGLPMIEEVLDYADYDYLIVEFFINDFNAQIPVQQWANNIAKICRKCYSRGVRPIVIAPCRVNSDTTHAPYWIKMFRGISVI